MSIPDETPLFIPEPVEESLLGTSRARASRSRQGDMLAVWIILGMVGLCGVGYAIFLALEPTPPVVTPPPVAAAAPSTPGDDHFGDDTVRLETLRHRLEERKNRADVPVRPGVETKQEPVVEVIREPEPAAPPPNDATSFDNGSAFDRPPVDSSRMRRRNGGSREFGSYQAPASRRQAETSDRPNQPDPSFDEPPADRPMRKTGARP